MSDASEIRMKRDLEQANIRAWDAKEVIGKLERVLECGHAARFTTSHFGGESHGESYCTLCEVDSLTARLAATEALLVRTRNGPLEWISPHADVVRHWLADMSVSVKEETIWHGVHQLHEVAVANQERRYILHQLLLEAAVGVGQKRFRSWLDDVRKALDITEIELASEVFKANEAAKGGRDE